MTTIQDLAARMRKLHQSLGAGVSRRDSDEIGEMASELEGMAVRDYAAANAQMMATDKETPKAAKPTTKKAKAVRSRKTK